MNLNAFERRAIEQTSIRQVREDRDEAQRKAQTSGKPKAAATENENGPARQG